jgi:hypothetical protein
MKMRYFIILSAVLFSCNETSQKSIPVSVIKNKPAVVHSNSQADFSVEGMVSNGMWRFNSQRAKIDWCGGTS